MTAEAARDQAGGVESLARGRTGRTIRQDGETVPGALEDGDDVSEPGALPHESEAPEPAAEPLASPPLRRKRRALRRDWLRSRPGGCPLPFIVGATLLAPLYFVFFRWMGHIRNYDPDELLVPMTHLLGHGGTLGDDLGLASDLGYHAEEDTTPNSSPAVVWSGHVMDDVYGPGSPPTGRSTRRIVLSKRMALVDVSAADLTYNHETGVLAVDALCYPDCDPLCDAEANGVAFTCCAPWLMSGMVVIFVAVLARRGPRPRDVVP